MTRASRVARAARVYDQAKIKTARGVLMHGTYGTGKTAVASSLASEAENHNVTFIYCTADLIQQAFEKADMYAPAIVFAEDGDLVMSGDRNQEMNNLLNTIDGVKKDRDTMLVLTSNDASSIHGAFLRPGRFDLILELTCPDEKAAEGIIMLYGADRVKQDEAKVAAQAAAGHTPVFIQAAVEKAKV